MKMSLKSKKSAFVVSMYHRNVIKIKNPKKGKPLYKVKDHHIPILIISNVNEMIDFLDRYTDFNKFNKGDFLAKKQDLKTSFSIDITELELLKKDILWDNQGFPSEDFFYKNFNEHLLNITRLPVGNQKRHLWEDLY